MDPLHEALRTADGLREANPLERKHPSNPRCPECGRKMVPSELHQAWICPDFDPEDKDDEPHYGETFHSVDHPDADLKHGRFTLSGGRRAKNFG